MTMSDETQAAHVCQDARLLTTLQRLLAIQATDLRPALDEAATLVAEALGADKVDVFLHQAPIDSLVALGTSATPMGRRQHELGLDRLPLSNGGRAADVFRTGEPYASGRVDEDPGELRGIVEGLGVRSVLDYPLEVGGERRGVVQADSATPDFFTEADQSFFAAVTQWVGMVMHRAELVEQATAAAARRGRSEATEEITRITRRHREVAVLIAEGLTNAEIARRLTLVEGTVANHVEHILRRLGLRGRTQIAVWAVEHGLYRLGEDDEDEPDQPEPPMLRPLR
jgi:DNA-binding CsgD family transcriptional regulator